MNDARHLREMHVQWTDLLRAYEGAEVVMNFVAGAIGRTNPPIPAGTYNQISISSIVDDYRGMKTMGRCYTSITFEAKIKG